MGPDCRRRTPSLDPSTRPLATPRNAPRLAIRDDRVLATDATRPGISHRRTAAAAAWVADSAAVEHNGSISVRRRRIAPAAKMKMRLVRIDCAGWRESLAS
jgi:hypothetical protein